MKIRAGDFEIRRFERGGKMAAFICEDLAKWPADWQKIIRLEFSRAHPQTYFRGFVHTLTIIMKT
jgi:hypothetical protein